MIFYVYRHIRLDTNSTFYVGKGKNNRAWSKRNRNNYWKNIVSSCGYKVEILFNNLQESEAFQKEIELIEFYKKQNECEANLTEGGLGSSGWKPTKEWIDKRKEKSSGKNNPMYGKASAMKGKKHTEEAKLKISKANKGRKNPPLTLEQKQALIAALKNKGSSPLKGRKLSEQHKLNIGNGVRGKMAKEKHPFYNKPLTENHKKNISSNSPKNKKVIDTKTNAVYANIKEAAIAFNIKRNTLKNYLSGRRTNKTSLRYLD
jgi:hypothetical protein